LPGSHFLFIRSARQYPVFDLKVLGLVRDKWCRNFRSAALRLGYSQKQNKGGPPAGVREHSRLMLDKFRQIVADLASLSGSEHRRFDDNDYRLAAAALLVHLISVDGDATETERRKLRSLLASRFELDDAAVDELMETATRVEGESVDIYHFTRLIMRAVDETGRARIVEMMWELVYADEKVSEFEESTIWRSADLLGISSNERIALKNRVAANRAAPKATN
jgi:uncharacterized tellurite resistance protein B-like protein